MNKQPKEGDLRVWHIPQVPGDPFYVSVPTPEEGKRMLNALAEYDQFQFENNIKPDYGNAQGLEMFEDDEWLTWLSGDGDDIDVLVFDADGQLVFEEVVTCEHDFIIGCPEGCN